MSEYIRKDDVNIIKMDLLTKGGAQDLRRLNVKIVIYEDMFQNMLTCDVTLFDTENLPEVNPIVGDEKLVLAFKSSKTPKGHDYPTINLTMNLTGIESKSSIEGSVKQTYVLTFVSAIGYKNLHNKLNRSFDAPESDIATNVLTNVLQAPKIDVEATKWPRKIVAPNMRPFEFLSYLATGSVRATGYPASNYLFWEDRDTHYFKSLDAIMEGGPAMTITSVIAGDLEWDNAPQQKLYNVSGYRSDFTFNDNLNTSNGLWAKEYIGQDIIKKKLTKHKWLYDSEWSASVQIDGGNEKLRTDYPTDTYISQQFGPWQEGLPEYNSWKVDDYGKRRQSMMQQFQNYRYICELEGDNNIRVGTKVEFKLPSHSHRNNGKDDEVLKGNWVVTRIRHEINQRQHTMFLELRKPHLKSFGPQEVIENGDHD